MALFGTVAALLLTAAEPVVDNTLASFPSAGQLQQQQQE